MEIRVILNCINVYKNVLCGTLYVAMCIVDAKDTRRDT